MLRAIPNDAIPAEDSWDPLGRCENALAACRTLRTPIEMIITRVLTFPYIEVGLLSLHPLDAQSDSDIVCALVFGCS